MPASTSTTRSSRSRVQAYRARLRSMGLKPIQIWVPDVRAASFKGEAHRQSLAAANSERAADDQAFLDTVSDWVDG
jgi:hypothetical protein